MVSHFSGVSEVIVVVVVLDVADSCCFSSLSEEEGEISGVSVVVVVVGGVSELSVWEGDCVEVEDTGLELVSESTAAALCDDSEGSSAMLFSTETEKISMSTLSKMQHSKLPHNTSKIGCSKLKVTMKIGKFLLENESPVFF